MNKNTFFIVVLLFLAVVARAQKIEAALINAVMAEVSSDYYFKKTTKSIKNSAQDAGYCFCKNAKCTDNNLLYSAGYYESLISGKFLKFKNYNKYMSTVDNLGKIYSKQIKHNKALALYFLGIKVTEKEKNDFCL